jgi:hypothetical protein
MCASRRGQRDATEREWLSAELLHVVAEMMPRQIISL